MAIRRALCPMLAVIGFAALASVSTSSSANAAMTNYVSKIKCSPNSVGCNNAHQPRSGQFRSRTTQQAIVIPPDLIKKIKENKKCSQNTVQC
jgi:LDH2 family malate/lactate/ureidoglycolate dehydrogenase